MHITHRTAKQTCTWQMNPAKDNMGKDMGKSQSSQTYRVVQIP